MLVLWQEHQHDSSLWCTKSVIVVRVAVVAAAKCVCGGCCWGGNEWDQGNLFILFSTGRVCQKKKKKIQIDFKRLWRGRNYVREWVKGLKKRKRGLVFQREAPGATAESLEEICHINKGGGICPFFKGGEIKKDTDVETQRGRVGQKEGGRRTGGTEWDWWKEEKLEYMFG